MLCFFLFLRTKRAKRTLTALAPVKPNVHPLGRKVFAMVQLYQRQYEVSMNDVLVVHKLKVRLPLKRKR